MNVRPWEGYAFPHQTEGASFFVEQGRGILGDDTGLGKTLTSLIWLDKINARKTLLTGPKEITSNLRQEVPRWTDRPVFDLRGYRMDQRETVFSLLAEFDEYICILNLEAWRKDSTILERLIKLQLDSIIIDEAHHINNERTLSYKGLREIVFAVNTCTKPTCGALLEPRYMCKRKNCVRQFETLSHRYCLACGHIATRVSLPPCSVCGSTEAVRRPVEARSVRHLLGMSATPLLNKPQDLFPLLHLIEPSRFTTSRRFLTEFCERSEHGDSRYTWTEEGKEALSRQIQPYYLARKKEDTGIILPPQGEYVREYDFDKVKYRAQWEAYQKIEREFRLEVEGETLGITEVVTQLLRLRQMLVWPDGIVIRDPETKEIVDRVSIGSSFKLDIVESLANEFLESGERIVVFSHFKAPLRELARRLGSAACVYDGSTPNAVRQDIRDDFGPKSMVAGFKPRWRAALCNYRSAGEGLNLMGATQAIRLDEEWSPSKNHQADGRIRRIGSKHATGIHIPRVVNTVDMWMAELNEFKQSLVDGFEESVSLNLKLREVMKR